MSSSCDGSGTVVNPQSWQNVMSTVNPQWHSTLKGATIITCMACTVTASLIAVCRLGLLQGLELRAYDWMYRQSPDLGVDPRIVTINLTEEDIRAQQRATPSDATIAQLLQTLAQHEPRVIGLDLYRDVPQEPGSDEALAVLRSTSTVVITKLGNSESDTIPAPAVAPENIGFNDLPIDPDGIVRRALLFASTDGETFYSFSLRLALRYLEDEGILPAPSPQNANYLTLGATTLTPLSADTGAYQQVDAAGYQILLNYRSRYISRRLTFTQVLEGDFEPEWIRDKIVLIGNAAPSGKDLFLTPYSASDSADYLMTGVDIHAQITSQLLSAALAERSLLWVAPAWAEVLWVLSWALIGGAIAWKMRHPFTLALVSVGLMVVPIGAGLLIFLEHGWLPIATPTLALLMTASGVVVHRAYTAHQQQQMVMTLLGQSTSPEVAKALWQNRDRLIRAGKLPGQQLVASVLFIDIAGFSNLAEIMPPEQLMLWLNEFLEEMTLSVQQHTGIVNKFTGDGLLAVFGVPVKSDSAEEIARNAYCAVACALDMGDRLQALHQSWQARHLPTPSMRAGIFTGAVVVGSLGCKDRLEYGVIGDSVNIASRLESCQKETQPSRCRILISDETLQYVKDTVDVEAWGEMLLKGKQNPLNVYRVLEYKTLTSLESDRALSSLAPPDSSEPVEKL